MSVRRGGHERDLQVILIREAHCIHCDIKMKETSVVDMTANAKVLNVRVANFNVCFNWKGWGPTKGILGSCDDYK